MTVEYTGKYTQAFLSDKISKDSSNTDFYKERIEVKNNEAVYVYSFKGNKMVFTKGFEKITNKKDDEISILELNNLFSPHFENFINEYHDRILLFLHTNNEKNETFSSHVIIKINNFDYPVILNIKVFETDDNGNLISIIGTTTIEKRLKTSDIVQYGFKGDFNPEFVEEINNDLEFNQCVSSFNIKIIELLELKKSYTDISNKLNISEEKIKNNLNKLLKRFELKNIKELIEFAKNNYLIPNQFDKYLNI